MYKIKNITLGLLLSTSLFFSCTESEMDRVNGGNNQNNPLDTEAKFLMTQLGTSTAFSTVGGDYSLYSSVYIEHEVGAHNQMYTAEVRSGSPTATVTYDNSWNTSYSNIKLAKLIIKKCSSGGSEENNRVTLGAAKVLLAYNAAVLTDLFGDIPFEQAGELDENLLPVYTQPKVDKQEDVYKKIFELLNGAIEDLDGSDKTAMGTNDLLYKGDAKSWKKAAYGLKARYTMRLLARSADKTTDLKNVLDYVAKSFTSVAEDLEFAKYDGVSQNNPLYAFSNIRYAFGGSKSYVNKLEKRNDPRYMTMFMNYNFTTGLFDAIEDVKNFKPAPNYIVGADTLVQSQLEYSINKTDFATKAPTKLLSYHELLFLQAEAYARLNDLSQAKASLQNAVLAGFDNLQNSLETIADGSGMKKVDYSATVVNDYLTKQVFPLFDANPIKEIMNQKYLAFNGASGESIEAYNDYRRLQALNEADYIELFNPLDKNSFPLRFIYGKSDAISNPEIKKLIGDGTYVYTEKVWWAGGSR